MKHLALKVMANEHGRHRATNRTHSEVTLRRERVYDFVQQYTIEHGGVAPLLREVARHFDISIGMAFADITWLEGQGRIQRKPSGARGIVLTSHVQAEFCPFCKRKR